MGIHEVKPGDKVLKTADAPLVSKKPPSAAEAFEQVVAIIRGRAAQIADVATNAAIKGQLAHVKYLFDLAGIERELGDTKVPGEGEEPLTARLLRQLGMPMEPKKKCDREEILRPEMDERENASIGSSENEPS